MITITRLAKNQLKKLVNKNNSKALYFYLQGGGCNGFNYKFDILEDDSKPHKLDETYKLDDNIPIYICHKSMMYILGTEVDYLQDIMGSRFTFSNNNISNTCGCGTSVNFKID